MSAAVLEKVRLALRVAHSPSHGEAKNATAFLKQVQEEWDLEAAWGVALALLSPSTSPPASV